jgi:hypothetical protein
VIVGEHGDAEIGFTLPYTGATDEKPIAHR